MAGILDLFGGDINDPRVQGLLAAFAAMGEASGPSKLPVTVASVLGKASMAGLGGYQSAQKQKMLEEQHKAEMELRRAHAEEYKAQAAQRQAKIEEENRLNQWLQNPANLMNVSQQRVAGMGAQAPGDFGPGETPNLPIQTQTPKSPMELVTSMIGSGSPTLAKMGLSQMAGLSKDNRYLHGANWVFDTQTQRFIQGPQADEKSPSSVKEYEYAVAQGYKGSYEKWVKDNKAASSTVISMQSPVQALMPGTDIPVLVQPANRPGAQSQVLSDASGRPYSPSKPERPLTVDQTKEATYALRAQQSEKALLENLGKASIPAITFKQGAEGSLLGLGTPLAQGANLLMSPASQKVEQAERNFINAVLRRESGAVINKDEFLNARKQYFPQPGDSKEVLKQKEQNRKSAIAGLVIGAGPAMQKILDEAKSSESAPDPLGIRGR